MRVYVSGYAGPPGFPGVIQRSDDCGATWQHLAIPGADDTHLPYIGAVDPNDPDIVYVRLDGPASPTRGHAARHQGRRACRGARALHAPSGNLRASRSPRRLHRRSSAPPPVVEQRAARARHPRALAGAREPRSRSAALLAPAHCLTWTPAGLYACAAEFADGFTAGISTDKGQTFQPLMHLGGSARSCAPSPTAASPRSARRSGR